MNRPVELLAPAGNPEKLEIAVRYGADAVYLGGKDFSLRNFSGNFSLAEMAEGIRFAHARGVRVYVTCNIYSRNHEQAAIRRYLTQVSELHPDAFIIADPAVFMAAQAVAPHIPLHLSTQANTTNFNAARFWERMGVRRINAARELTLEEIAGIAEKTELEVEAFVHGAMCISYSGRCLLSSFMAGRDSNRGLCCHPCRFQYTVMEEKRPGQYHPVAEDARGTYLFNSRDLCMIGHLPEMLRAGVDSLKIEGRMKGINYLAGVLKVYREALDLYRTDPDHYTVRPEWRAELDHLTHRGYCTGFYFGDPEQVRPNTGQCIYAPTHRLAGKVLEQVGDNHLLVAVRNRMATGDKIQILSPCRPTREERIRAMATPDGVALSIVQPNTRVILTLDGPGEPDDLIRTIQPPSEQPQSR